MPEPRIGERGYVTLLRAIVGQQVSIKAAAAIWAKVEAATGGAADPANMARTSDEDLRAAGLSRQKIAYAQSLAEEVLSGRLDFDNLPADDEEAIAASDRGQGHRPLDRRNLSAVRRGPPRHLPGRRPRRPDRDRQHHGPRRASRPRKRSARSPRPGAPTAAPRRSSPGTTGGPGARRSDGPEPRERAAQVPCPHSWRRANPLK